MFSLNHFNVNQINLITDEILSVTNMNSYHRIKVEKWSKKIPAKQSNVHPLF